jgi:hypothetical protein
LNTPKRARAKIHWLSPSEGGRTAPPGGPRYVTIVRFESSVCDWQKDAWSLVIEFDQPPNNAGEHTALVWFLAYDKPDVPHDLLRVENKFELLEGTRVVAQGTIVEELGP